MFFHKMEGYRLLIFLFFLVWIPPTSLFGQDADKVVAYGKFKIEWGDVENSKIILFEDGKELETYYTTNNGKFEFILQLNHNYLFQFEKAGYVTKKVEFNTQVPSNITSDPNFEPFQDFDFNVTLFKTYPEVDTMFFENPVGKIRYESSINDFDYDKEYTLEIVRRMEEIEEQIRQKHEEAENILKKREKPDNEVISINEDVEDNKTEVFQHTDEVKETNSTKMLEPSQTAINELVSPSKNINGLTGDLEMEKSKPEKNPTSEILIKEPTSTNDSQEKKVTRISITQNNSTHVYIKVEYKWGGRFFFIQDEENQYRNISESFYNLMVKSTYNKK